MSRFSFLAALLASLLAAAPPLPALTVNFKWDPAINGYYQVDSQPQPDPLPRTRHRDDSSLELAPERKYRLMGPGFSVPFGVVNGKLDCDVQPKVGGIVLDRASLTISFAAVPLALETRDSDVAVDVEGVTTADPSAPGAVPPPPADPAAPRTLNVVWGHHNLVTPAGRVPVEVDKTGHVTLPEQTAGFAVTGNRVVATGLPFHFLPPASVPSWTAVGIKGGRDGEAVLRLLPGPNAYRIALPGAKTPLTFFVGTGGLLATAASGPFDEVVSLPVEGTDGAFVVEVPGGRERKAARLRQAEADEALAKKLLAATDGAPWKKDFVLSDAMRIYDFPEELLSYPVDFPPGKVKADDLKLVSLAGPVRLLPFQLSAVAESGGFLTHAVVSFRSGLNRGERRLFRLLVGEVPGLPPVEKPALEVASDANGLVIVNDLVRLRAPKEGVFGGGPLASLPAPIVSLGQASRPDAPALTGSLDGPAALVADKVETTVLEKGPLFVRYRVAYKLGEKKSYEAVVTVRSGEMYATVDESLAGLEAGDRAFLRLDYGEGKANPNQRLVACQGYDLYGGAYDRGKDANGKLNFVLGLYTPNSLGLMRGAAFLNEASPDALVFAVYRQREWVTTKWAVWTSLSAAENLRFYDVAPRKYMEAALCGSKRFWAVGVIPREKAAPATLDLPDLLIGGHPPGAGPEIRLCQKLQDLSLDAWKDRAVDFPEELAADPFPLLPTPPGNEFTYDEWEHRYLLSSFDAMFVHGIISNYWDYALECGPICGRGSPGLFYNYAHNRAKWTEEQRRHARSILLFLTECMAGDAMLPHVSMLGGHPNFAMDGKAGVAIACGVFRGSPDAPRWKEEFLRFYREWFDKYQRQDDPEHRALGGRWTENIAGYGGVCLTAIHWAALGMKQYDGTDLLANPGVSRWIRWLRDVSMSPQDGVRYIPPQGAHARGMEPDQEGGRSLHALIQEMKEAAPELSREMLWMETNGKEGKRPDVRSVLYRDYGPVFHYDFGGPHESYAHVQNIYGSSYRWAGAGIVYYGARQKLWSFNCEDDDGDRYDTKNLSTFTVKGQGLTPGPTDQVLYDFGFAQYYRTPSYAAPGADGAAPKTTPYLARGLMLLRDDYLVLCDEVKDASVPGAFTWASTFGQPEIYQLKPGAAAVESTSTDNLPRRPKEPPARTSHIRTYAGKGDFLTVVAPEAVQASAQPFGALVGGEYVFSSPKAPLDFHDDKASFKGATGYARADQIALFDGTMVGYGGLELERRGGDFGASAEAREKSVTGRAVGRQGGELRVRPPFSFAGTPKVVCGGKPAEARVEDGAVVFTVTLSQADGPVDYEISF